MTQKYNKTQIIDAIKLYEHQILGKGFIKELSETPAVLFFKGSRKDRISILSLHVWPENDIDAILSKVVELMESIPNMSDSINFYSTSCIDSALEEKLKTIAGNKYELTLDVYDYTRMRSLPFFKNVFAEDADEEELSFIEKALYDYMASSEDSSYLKNSLYYSLILLILFNYPDGLTLTDLETVLYSRTGKRIEKLDVVIRALRRDGHLEKPKAGDPKLYLTQSEKDCILDSIRRTKAAEDQFNETFSNIVEKYKISESQTLSEKLRDIIIAECKNTDSQDDHDEVQEKNQSVIEEYINDLKNFVNQPDLVNFVKDISELLNNNTYLVTLSLGEKLLDLYKSDRYEQYIKNKKNIVVLDTMVFAYMICCFSHYNEEIGESWNDIDYQKVYDLHRYWKEHHNSITFAVPVDYIDETIGELRKALQLTWFSGIDLSMPLSTSNIFYNYYLYVCSIKKRYEEWIPSFDEFLHSFGFENLDVDSVYFKRDAAKVIISLVRAMDMELWNDHPHYERFEDVKHEYQFKLADRYKNKSDSATNNDVRVSFCLANKYAPENHYDDGEYYWTSWDKTLKDLRKVTNDHLSLTHSYEIRTPGDLVQTLAFKSFDIDKAKIGNEVFAYANELYGFTSKATSLFDNILNPFFASKNNKNTELVKLLLKLESAREQQPSQMEESSRNSSRTVLEDFFMMIIDRLARNSCGTSELRDFLADSENNNNIVDIISQAYKTEEESDRIKLAFQFVDCIKKFVADRQSHKTEVEG